MPAFFLNTEQYIHGIVMANYTSGAPVRGNLTLKATVRPITPIDVNKVRKYRPRVTDVPNQYYDPNSPYNQNNRFSYNPSQNNYNNLDQGSYNKPIVEKYFNFDEKLPFWFTIHENYYEPIPVMKFVSSDYSFYLP